MRTLLIFLLLTATSAFARPLTKADADALYAKEQYRKAAEAYEALIKREGESAALYYNLAGSYYKLDEYPLAILNYERALLLDPSDADTRANLALARAKTIDRVTPPSEMFFTRWWRAFVNFLPMAHWGIIAIASFILMLTGILLYMFVSSITVRKIGVYSAFVLLVLCVAANLCAYSQHCSLTHRDAAIVVSTAVAVKSSPSDTSTDLFVMHEGSKVTILDRSMSHWFEVKLEEGKQGWIHTDDVEVI